MLMVSECQGFNTAVLQPTSYANSGGSGNRTAIVTASTTAAISAQVAGGTIDNLVDGGLAANTTDGIDFTSANFVGGDYFRFDFGANRLKYIDEVKLYMDRLVNWGNWIFQGSDDAATWTSLNTFAWSGTTITQSVVGMRAMGYRYFQMLKSGSTTGTVPVFLEVEFKIAVGEGS